MIRVTSFARTVLVDTGFWYALWEPGDAYHNQALEREHFLSSMNVLVPWPSLYETFNTRFVKNKIAVRNFEALLRKTHVVQIPDEPYREKALTATVSMALNSSRSISLVDMVIRQILEDVYVRKHGLLTFNPGDFSDLCRRHQIEVL